MSTRLRLLMVEDSDDDKEIVLRELRRGGYDPLYERVDTAEAMNQALSEGSWDVVICDYSMPHFDPFAALGSLKTSGLDLPFIIVSGKVGEETAVAAMKAGAHDFLMKSKLARLNAVVERELKEAEMRRERRLAEEALRASEQSFRLLVESVTDYAIFSLDTAGHITSWNAGVERVLGYTEAEIIGQHYRCLFTPEDIERETPERELREAMNESRSGSDRWHIGKGGNRFYATGAVHPLRDEAGGLLGFSIVMRDETERWMSEERLTHAAFHDALTRLPNRLLFIEHLKQAIAFTKRHDNYLFAVLFLDLDRFKTINDSFGHVIADRLLVIAAHKLRAILRPEDIVARLGGDEFTILLANIKDVSDATHVASRIGDELQQPFNLDGHDVFTSASIGIALSLQDYDQPEEVLRDADTAMYSAKAEGQGRYQIFDPSMHERVMQSLKLETDLRRAVERDEFEVHYQPLVLLRSGKIVGFEALVRWQHPERGLVSPAEFIPVAEETGLIVQIGQWVLHEACQQMCQWQNQFPAGDPLAISVNLSSKQFAQANLIEQIHYVLQHTGLDAHSLRLEITESGVMENADSAALLLQELRNLGVKLHIDDFGTGYSSLSYLHRFPIDMLKIDRSFISHICANDENSEIVRTIVQLALNLRMEVIAEGVETKEQLAHLKKLECQYGQGYLFSRPVTSAQAGALIAG